MSKFWTVATILLLAGVLLVYLPSDQGINFTDLETECRYERNSEHRISLDHNRLQFSGYFPVNNPEADMRYDYSRNSKSIVLNVRSSSDRPVTNYHNNCVATGVYDAETSRLEDGRYTVTLKHQGERVDKRVISVR